MNQIELIKAEITSIKDLTGVGLNEYDMGYENGVCETCNRLLSFIESLEKGNIGRLGKDGPIVEFVGEPEPQGLDEAAKKEIYDRLDSLRGEYMDDDELLDETRIIYNIGKKAGAKMMAERYEKLSGELVTESTK